MWKGGALKTFKNNDTALFVLVCELNDMVSYSSVIKCVHLYGQVSISMWNCLLRFSWKCFRSGSLLQFFFFFWSVSSLFCVWIRGEDITFPHEGAFAVVHQLFCNQAVIDHLVFFHAAKAAVLHTAVQLILRQRALQVGAHLLNSGTQVLQHDGQSLKWK